MSEFDDLITGAAAKYNLDPDLFRRQLIAESGLKNIVNPASGAAGVAQFMPATARGLGIDPMVPAQAIPAAALYMRQNLNRFGGDYDKALAAYNWGPGNVSARGMDNLPAETRAYIAKIKGGGNVPNDAGSGGVATPGPLLAASEAGPPQAPAPLLPPPMPQTVSLGDVFLQAARKAQGIA